MERTDEQLLAAYAAGDQAALGLLADRHELALLGLARGILGSRTEALDAVQEAWVRVIRFAGAFKGHSSVKTWLYRIVINECANLLNARRRVWGPSVANGGSSPGDAGSAGGSTASGTPTFDEFDDIRRAVDELDGPKRVVVMLCYSAGVPHELAAEILGLPLGTLKSRLHAALTTLRRRLAQGVTP